MKKVMLLIAIAISFIGNTQILGMEDYTATALIKDSVVTGEKTMLANGDYVLFYPRHEFGVQEFGDLLNEYDRIVEGNEENIEDTEWDESSIILYPENYYEMYAHTFIMIGESVQKARRIENTNDPARDSFFIVYLKMDMNSIYVLVEKVLE